MACILKDKRQRKFEKKHKLKKKEWWLWLTRIVTFFLVMLALVSFCTNTLGLWGCFHHRVFHRIQEDIVCGASFPSLSHHHGHRIALDDNIHGRVRGQSVHLFPILRQDEEISDIHGLRLPARPCRCGSHQLRG